MDLTPILALIKGKSADNFKAVIEGMKMLNDEMKSVYSEIKEKNKQMEKKIEELVKLEADCLQRNIEANELIRNLTEWIIFEEKRPEIKRNIAYLINGKK